ncbi:hypothetical protein PAHAL_4G066900 [Panicum hallii]|uniref:Uncharacterized protein n=1 Tax=Panicum hallii TaxID=206008 RepID=A0A2T8JC02_9POAL|nr:hypothetical protein PAHAL_4G066900 [Panicum hallii]
MTILGREPQTRNGCIGATEDRVKVKFDTTAGSIDGTSKASLLERAHHHCHSPTR